MGVEAPEECGYWLGLAQPLPAQYWLLTFVSFCHQTEGYAQYSAMVGLGFLFFNVVGCF